MPPSAAGAAACTSLPSAVTASLTALVLFCCRACNSVAISLSRLPPCEWSWSELLACAPPQLAPCPHPPAVAPVPVPEPPAPAPSAPPAPPALPPTSTTAAAPPPPPVPPPLPVAPVPDGGSGRVAPKPLLVSPSTGVVVGCSFASTLPDVVVLASA